MVGLILFGFTGVFFWLPGAVTGPVIVVLGVVGRSQAKASGERTTLPTVVIVLGVIAFVLGLIMAAIVSSPDFEI